MGDKPFFTPFPKGEGKTFGKSSQHEIHLKHTVFQIIYAISRAWLTNRVLVKIASKDDIQYKKNDTEELITYNMSHFQYKFKNTEEIRLASTSLNKDIIKSVGENQGDEDDAKLEQLTMLATLFRDIFDPITSRSEAFQKLISDLENKEDKENTKYGILRFFYHPLFINKETAGEVLSTLAIGDVVMRLNTNPKKNPDKKYWIDVTHMGDFATKIQKATKDTILLVLQDLSNEYVTDDDQLGIFLNRCSDNFGCMDSKYVNQLIEDVKEKEEKNKENLKMKYPIFMANTMRESFLDAVTSTLPKNITNLGRFRKTIDDYIQFVQQLQFCYLIDPKLRKIDRFGTIDYQTAQKLLEPIEPKKFQTNEDVKDSFIKVLEYLYNKALQYKIDEIKDEFIDIGGLLERLHTDKASMVVFQDKSYSDLLYEKFGNLGYFYTDGNTLWLRSKIKIAQTKLEKNIDNDDDVFVLHNKNEKRIGYLDKSEYAKFLYFSYAMYKINSERPSTNKEEIEKYDYKMRKAFMEILENQDFETEFKKGFNLSYALSRMNELWDTEVSNVLLAFEKHEKKYKEALKKVAETDDFLRNFSEDQRKRFWAFSYANAFYKLRLLNKIEDTTAMDFITTEYDPIIDAINSLYMDHVKSSDPKKVASAEKVVKYLPEYFLTEPLPKKFELRNDNYVVDRRKEGWLIFRTKQNVAYVGIPRCKRSLTDSTVEFERRVQQLVHVFAILFESESTFKRNTETNVSGGIQQDVIEKDLPTLWRLLVGYFLKEEAASRPIVSAPPAPTPRPPEKVVTVPPKALPTTLPAKKTTPAPADNPQTLPPTPALYVPESDDEKTEDAPETPPAKKTIPEEEWLKNEDGTDKLDKAGKKIPKPYKVDQDGYVIDKKGEPILDEKKQKVTKLEYESLQTDDNTGQLEFDDAGKKQTKAEYKERAEKERKKREARTTKLKGKNTNIALNPKELSEDFQKSIIWENATYNWNNLPLLQGNKKYDNFDQVLEKLHPASFVNLPTEEGFMRFSKPNKKKIVEICFGNLANTQDIPINYDRSFALWQEHFTNRYADGISAAVDKTYADVKYIGDITEDERKNFVNQLQAAADKLFYTVYSKRLTLQTANQGFAILREIFNNGKLNSLKNVLTDALKILEITKEDGSLKTGGWATAGAQSEETKPETIPIRNNERMGRLWRYFCVLVIEIFNITKNNQNKSKALKNFKTLYRLILERKDVDSNVFILNHNISTVKNILENIERDEVYCKDGVYQHDLLQHGIFNTIEEYADKHWETISKSVPWRGTFERMNVVPGGGERIGLDASWGHEVSTKYLHCLSLIADVLDSLDNERLVDEDLLVRCNAEWPKEKIPNNN